MRAWTDYPIVSLGDRPHSEAPVREVEVLSYDGDKYCRVRVGGVEESIKAGYLYQLPGRRNNQPPPILLTREQLRKMEAPTRDLLTVDEHIAQAKEWGAKLPAYPGMVGWRTTCRALAEEVERLRAEARSIDLHHERIIAVWKREEDDWIEENSRYEKALMRISDLIEDTNTLQEAVSIAVDAMK